MIDQPDFLGFLIFHESRNETSFKLIIEFTLYHILGHVIQSSTQLLTV